MLWTKQCKECEYEEKSIILLLLKLEFYFTHLQILETKLISLEIYF